jgi:hypothetical protein
MVCCGARLSTKPRSAGGLAVHPRLPEVDEIRRHTALLKSLSADFPSECRGAKTHSDERRRTAPDEMLLPATRPAKGAFEHAVVSG